MPLLSYQLYCNANGSDKEYQIYIDKNDNNYVLTSLNGKRGNTLSSNHLGTFTSLDEAKLLMATKLKEKIKGDYYTYDTIDWQELGIDAAKLLKWNLPQDATEAYQNAIPVSENTIKQPSEAPKAAAPQALAFDQTWLNKNKNSSMAKSALNAITSIAGADYTKQLLTQLTGTSFSKTLLESINQTFDTFSMIYEFQTQTTQDNTGNSGKEVSFILLPKEFLIDGDKELLGTWDEWTNKNYNLPKSPETVSDKDLYVRAFGICRTYTKNPDGTRQLGPSQLAPLWLDKTLIDEQGDLKMSDTQLKDLAGTIEQFQSFEYKNFFTETNSYYIVYDRLAYYFKQIKKLPVYPALDPTLMPTNPQKDTLQAFSRHSRHYEQGTEKRIHFLSALMHNLLFLQQNRSQSTLSVRDKLFGALGITDNNSNNQPAITSVANRWQELAGFANTEHLASLFMQQMQVPKHLGTQQLKQLHQEQHKLLKSLFQAASSRYLGVLEKWFQQNDLHLSSSEINALCQQSFVRQKMNRQFLWKKDWALKQTGRAGAKILNELKTSFIDDSPSGAQSIHNHEALNSVRLDFLKTLLETDKLQTFNQMFIENQDEALKWGESEIRGNYGIDLLRLIKTPAIISEALSFVLDIKRMQQNGDHEKANLTKKTLFFVLSYLEEAGLDGLNDPQQKLVLKNLMYLQPFFVNTTTSTLKQKLIGLNTPVMAQGFSITYQEYMDNKASSDYFKTSYLDTSFFSSGSKLMMDLVAFDAKRIKANVEPNDVALLIKDDQFGSLAKAAIDSEYYKKKIKSTNMTLVEQFWAHKAITVKREKKNNTSQNFQVPMAVAGLGLPEHILSVIKDINTREFGSLLAVVLAHYVKDDLPHTPVASVNEWIAQVKACAFENLGIEPALYKQWNKNQDIGQVLQTIGLYNELQSQFKVSEAFALQMYAFNQSIPKGERLLRHQFFKAMDQVFKKYNIPETIKTLFIIPPKGSQPVGFTQLGTSLLFRVPEVMESTDAWEQKEKQMQQYTLHVQSVILAISQRVQNQAKAKNQDLETVIASMQIDAGLLSDYFSNMEPDNWQQMPEQKALTWNYLMQQQDDWHKLVSIKGNGAEGSWPVVLGSYVRNGVSVCELASGAALLEEGRKMHHCVASYAPRCKNGVRRIFHIENMQDQTTVEVGFFIGKQEIAIEQLLSGKYNPESVELRVLQNLGKYNRQVKNPALDAALDQMLLDYKATLILHAKYYKKVKLALSLMITDTACQSLTDSVIKKLQTHATGSQLQGITQTDASLEAIARASYVIIKKEFEHLAKDINGQATLFKKDFISVEDLISKGKLMDYDKEIRMPAMRI